MIVYADREELVDTAVFQRRVEQASDPTERLIVQGQLESAVGDALCPEVDREVDLAGRMPPQISVRVPEGYAFYSLYPDAYQEAANRFVRERRPDGCVVVGIRSIGTSLSRVVADEVDAQWSFTVRPRGHPFSRELRLAAELEQKIKAHSESWFLIVDEGPGLSGSSFMCVAGKLEELGVPAGRIVLFPSHAPDPGAFKSDIARRNWGRYLMYVDPFRAERYLPPDARDLSGGLWREMNGMNVPVQPQHERRKYLHEDRLWKFEGVAHFGRARYERAQRLTAFSPAPCAFTNGFVVSEWVQGRPARLSEELLDVMARYLVFLRAEFSTTQPVRTKALEEMIEVNTGRAVTAPAEGVVIAGDGRMLPQEWIETSDGYVKTDALDHHDDHFFPGCQDIAWDIAGAAVEWDFPVDALLDRYLRLQNDMSLRSRIPFYVTAYKAFRFGYCMMAAENLGETSDGYQYSLLARKYA